MFKKDAMIKELSSLLTKIAKNDISAKRYTKKFKKMSAKEVQAYLEWMVANNKGFSIIKPVSSKPPMEMGELLKIAKKIGCQIFEPFYMPSSTSGMKTKTKHKALICQLQVRRLSQALLAKISVPNDDKSVDSFTQQPTRKSSGASISGPELELLASYGLEKVSKELSVIRGGDMGQYLAYKALLSSQGMATQETTKNYSTDVRSSMVMRNIFLSAMIEPA